MALIKCPECNHDMSDTADFCPNCGYKFKQSKKILGKKRNIDTFKSIAKSINTNDFFKKTLYRLEYIVKLEWADDFHNWLSDIPIIGKLLSFLFMFILIISVLAIIIFIGGTIIEYFFDIAPALVIAVGTICLNVFNWFTCFKWHYRKEWFFWVGLFLTGGFGLLLFCVYL